MFGNSNIPESYSDAYLVASNCVFCLLVCTVIFLWEAVHGVLGERNTTKEAFSEVVVRCKHSIVLC